MENLLIKRISYINLIGALAIGLLSCGKYDDGPGLSLRTKKARLVGDWEVVRIGSQAYPSGGYSVEMEFEKNGDVSLIEKSGASTFTYNGTWEFSSNKEELDLIMDGDVYTYEIKRLTNKEVWIEDQYNEEWRLEAQ